MTKWFEEVANDASNIVSSRVRLSRNWVTGTVSFMNMKIWN